MCNKYFANRVKRTDLETTVTKESNFNEETEVQVKSGECFLPFSSESFICPSSVYYLIDLNIQNYNPYVFMAWCLVKRRESFTFRERGSVIFMP
jgi:hypothetical protein